MPIARGSGDRELADRATTCEVRERTAASRTRPITTIKVPRHDVARFYCGELQQRRFRRVNQRILQLVNSQYNKHMVCAVD
jgi:hypothetical protein